MAKLLGLRSGTAWAGRTGKHKHRVFPSWRQSLRAHLRKTCYHSCDIWDIDSCDIFPHILRKCHNNILQAVYGETRNNSLFSDHIQEDLSGTNITLVSQAYTSAQKIFK